MHKRVAVLLAWMLLTPAVAGADNYVTPGQFIGEKTLVSFWSSDCSACSRQLPVLISLAKFYPDTQFVLVSLEGAEGTAEIPHTLPSNFLVRSVSNAATSLRAFGATKTMLPFSAFLSINGSVCKSHAGLQGQGTLEDWIKKC
jgi:thiol-disulfide isomerase/thioredoxin